MPNVTSKLPMEKPEPIGNAYQSRCAVCRAWQEARLAKHPEELQELPRTIKGRVRIAGILRPFTHIVRPKCRGA